MESKKGSCYQRLFLYGAHMEMRKKANEKNKDSSDSSIGTAREK